MADQITAHAVAELEQAGVDIEQERKRVAAQGSSLVKQLSESKRALAKSKDNFYKVSRELELAEYQLEELTDNPKKKGESEKLGKKLAKLRQDVDASATAYREQLEMTNAVQSKFYNEAMPIVMDDLQCVFQRRNVAIENSCKNFVESSVRMSSEVIEPHTKLQEAVASISASSDLNEYIQTVSVDSVKVPQPFVFESYVKRGREQSETVKKPGLFSRHRKGQKDDKSTVASYSPYAKSSSSTESLSSVFGTHLTALLEREQATHPGLGVPYVLVYSAEKIIALGGESTVGIFRLNGLTSSVEKLRQSINRGTYPDRVPTSGLHDVASLVKLFFRQLPAPLVPDDVYQKCFASPPPTAAEFADMLPAANRATLEFMIGFLKMFSRPEVAEVTKMNSLNIAAVFAPCFFRCPYSDPFSILKAAGEEQAFIAKLLAELDTSRTIHLTSKIFGDISTEPESHQNRGKVGVEHQTNATESELAGNKSDVLVENGNGDITENSSNRFVDVPVAELTPADLSKATATAPSNYSSENGEEADQTGNPTISVDDSNDISHSV